ncbi:hypothetical protein MRX96_013562 [Rhipicephalus microplus]
MLPTPTPSSGKVIVIGSSIDPLYRWLLGLPRAFRVHERRPGVQCYSRMPAETTDMHCVGTPAALVLKEGELRCRQSAANRKTRPSMRLRGSIGSSEEPIGSDRLAASA